MSDTFQKFGLLGALTLVLAACGGADREGSCFDGQQNGSETDIDCGGPSCGACIDGRMCSVASDCLGAQCFGGRCLLSFSTGGGGGSSSTGGGGGASATGGGGGSSSTGGGGGGSSTGGGGGGSMTGGGGGSMAGGGGGSMTGGGGGSMTGGGGGSMTGGGSGGGGGSTGGGGGSVVPGTLVIHEVQTRGDMGGNDEFIELYNPGDLPVLFDSTWTLSFRSATGTCSTNPESVRVTGAGQSVPAHGYLLLTNSAYNGAVASDGTYTVGLVDAGSLVLRRDTQTIDALCFHFDTVTSSALTTCSVAYVCEGTPILNPHNNTTTSNQDTSLERTGSEQQNNSIDFGPTAVSTPRNRFSTATP